MFERMKGALAAALVSAALFGCAHPQLVDVGQTRGSVVEYLGEPQAITEMPDGTQRMTYSGQPFGQDVWWIFLRDGRVVAREQGLQEKYFPMIKPGVWTEKDVWAFWGTCAQKYEFHLVGEHAWMYRYKESGTGMDMAVWPQFNKDGVVTSVETTLDPWKKDGDAAFMSF